MRKAGLIAKRKIALLSTLNIIKILLEDIEANTATFNKLLVQLDKLDDGDTSTLELDVESLVEDVKEWQAAIKAR